MLQKCVYAMISQRELAGQQVASYLMDFEDHFTSHSYRNLYWTAFESFINKELPSPECYPAKKTDPDAADLEPAEGIREKNDSPEAESVAPRVPAPDGEDTESEDNDDDNLLFLNDLSEIQPQENEVSIDGDDTEIRVSVDQDGNLVSTGIRKTSDCRKHTLQDDSYDDDGLGDDFNDEAAHENGIDDTLVDTTHRLIYQARLYTNVAWYFREN
ncbi:hypothetical protein B0H14DRAFT_2645062 [Mycena olivaceomarginata]|nr:hypothetical protein B0H14DRAFT_2645062 [Mycena olivaceomarginata]